MSVCGFFIINSVFTWPKLSAAAFGCGVYGLWAIPKRGAVCTGIARRSAKVYCRSPSRLFGPFEGAVPVPDSKTSGLHKKLRGTLAVRQNQRCLLYFSDAPKNC